MSSEVENELSSDEVELEEFGGDNIDYSGLFATEEAFQSLEEAHTWANNVARPIGFEFVIASHKTSSVPGRKLVYMRCWRYGKYRGKINDLDEEVNRKTRTKACGCQFVIAAKSLSQGQPWVIRVREGDRGKHNHSFIVYNEGRRRANRLTDKMKGHVREMTATGSTPANILTSMRQKFPEVDVNVGQIYNERARERADEMGDMTHVQLCLHLASEHGYVTGTDFDSDGELRQIFMAHPFSIQLLRTYPYVIIIDTTYKTSAAKWPFCEIVGVAPTNHNFLIGYSIMRDERKESFAWVLGKVKNLLPEDVTPNAIITDRDEGMAWAIGRVFPGVPHLLCVWHIGNDVEVKVSALTGGKK